MSGKFLSPVSEETPDSQPPPAPFYSSFGFAGAESLAVNNYRVFILGALRRGRLSGGERRCGGSDLPKVTQ